MEKIKVNMSPNPLDVQTIHASQNDGEARQWEFELHNNGELIDTSDVKEQLVFKAYEGGTEQLLPENTSTPTTSPFIGDIRYPQGLLTDQEFTYRQSPTEEDGLAKITDIKGNTLVWNQLLNISVATSMVNGITYTINGDGSISISGTATATADKVIATNVSYISGHKYLLTGGKSSDLSSNVNAPNNWKNSIRTDRANGTIIECINSYTGTIFLSVTNGATVNTKITPMLIDLTQMGLDITDPSDFTSLFPLSYYSYNQGSLLSFNGNGIKTVGFNLADISTSWQGSWTDIETTSENNIRVSLAPIKTIGVSSIYIKSVFDFWVRGMNANNALVYTSAGWLTDRIINLPSGVDHILVTFRRNANNDNLLVADFKVENIELTVNISDVSKNGTYEPYTSSTLSLPTQQYFPNGMKSAGTVYDELTNSKATTRVKQITFDGSNDENWNVVLSTHRAYIAVSDIDTSAPDTSIGNIMSNMYVAGAYSRGAVEDIITTRERIAQINIFDSVNITSSSTTDTWRAYLQEHPLIVNYEIATPTETPFTTASLVTENAEIPLSNDDGALIGKCTEQLSENPGFIDAKIKLSDADGECYSNKIQLHVERSPQ